VCLCCLFSYRFGLQVPLFDTRTRTSQAVGVCVCVSCGFCGCGPSAVGGVALETSLVAAKLLLVCLFEQQISTKMCKNPTAIIIVIHGFPLKKNVRKNPNQKVQSRLCVIFPLRTSHYAPYFGISPTLKQISRNAPFKDVTRAGGGVCFAPHWN
jgi:hypothetical protein